MVTEEQIRQIAADGSAITVNGYEFKVFRDNESYDAPYWCLSKFKPKVGGIVMPFSQRLTKHTIERMIEVIKEA